jgi:citronellol/citronellal dehydrogenase
VSQPNPYATSDKELAERKTFFAPDALLGQTVLISGGSGSIGKATAWLAARLGANVIVTGRTEEKLAAATAALGDRGFNARYRTVNVRDRMEVDALFAWVADTVGRLDILINSAGGQFPQPAIDFSERGWSAVIDTNLNGTFHTMQAAARTWQKLGTPGSIVSIVVEPRGLHGVAHTLAARAGVIAFSQAVSVEWAPLNIRVNCVAPGLIRSEGWVVYSEEARATYSRSNPMMRAGDPWTVAEACVYVGGPASDYVTGEVFTVDGGGRHWGEIWTTGKPGYFRTETP